MIGRGQTGSKSAQSRKLNRNGNVMPLHETFLGKPIFRKEYPSNIEQQIAAIIMHNPHPNIVTVYAVSPEKIDMELVNPISTETIDYLQLERAKEHLQKLGISYIDWKVDNIGIGADGFLKVYDFDMSYIFDIDTNQFMNGPELNGYKFRMAKNRGLKKPRNMNNAVFSMFRKNK
jgi:hypothetical protein